MVSNGNLLEFVLELSRELIEIEQICQWLKCAPRCEEQSINSVFLCKWPGYQVIVCDATNWWWVMETRWNIVLELSREPFEIEQICQGLKCAPRWEEESINSVFQCKSPGSQFKVGDVTNWWRVMETSWNLVLELSREPFEIEQICQWLKCAPRWEEESINGVRTVSQWWNIRNYHILTRIFFLWNYILNEIKFCPPF